MKVSILMYDKMDLLNFAELNAFFRLFKNASVTTFALKPEIADEWGMKLIAQACGESLYGTEILAVPNGAGAASLRYDEIFLSWVKSGSAAKIKLGFGSGALVLGGAGFLADKEACARLEHASALAEYCAVKDAAFCEADGIITATGWNEPLENRLAEILR